MAWIMFLLLRTYKNQNIKDFNNTLSKVIVVSEDKFLLWFIFYDTNSIVNCNKQTVACCLDFSVAPIEIMKTLFLKEKL